MPKQRKANANKDGWYLPDYRTYEQQASDAFHASLVMAGIAAETCSCTDKKHSACGLATVIEALATKEQALEHEWYGKTS